MTLDDRRINAQRFCPESAYSLRYRSPTNLRMIPGIIGGGSPSEMIMVVAMLTRIQDNIQSESTPALVKEYGSQTMIPNRM